MGNLTSRLDLRLYPHYAPNWDDALFRERVLAVLRPEHHLLDLGAGAGIVAAMNFRGRAARVCGVDPDPRVRENPFLDEGRVGTGERIDYPDASFDVAIADNVLEHLEDPAATFAEIHRVLKPGGRFLFKTPNRFHYMPLVSRITPLRFHRAFNRMRGRAAVDTFPTRYRANSRGQIRALAARTGYRVAELELVEGRPEYLRFSVPTYLVGWLYERLVNSTALLADLRILLIGQLEKR